MTIQNYEQSISLANLHFFYQPIFKEVIYGALFLNAVSKQLAELL